MKIVDTDSNYATIEVMPNECFRLAQACEIAAAAVGGCNVIWEAEIQGREDLTLLWEVMASLFEALGTAAAAPMYMSRPEAEAYSLQNLKRERLAELNNTQPWGKRDDTPPSEPPPAKGNKAA